MRNESISLAITAAIVVALAVGFVVGVTVKTDPPKPACECKEPKCCEPQKLEITLHVEGEIPVTGEINVESHFQQHIQPLLPVVLGPPVISGPPCPPGTVPVQAPLPSVMKPKPAPCK